MIHHGRCCESPWVALHPWYACLLVNTGSHEKSAWKNGLFIKVGGGYSWVLQGANTGRVSGIILLIDLAIGLLLSTVPDTTKRKYSTSEARHQNSRISFCRELAHRFYMYSRWHIFIYSKITFPIIRMVTPSFLKQAEQQ